MASKQGTRVGIYMRVSTREQTTDNQRLELERAIEHRGWHIAASFEDAAISGAKGRDKRPGFDKLIKAVTRREVDIVAAWSVDRLGRSLQDLLEFLGIVHGAGCDLYLHQQGVDTRTPAGRALFQMLGVFSEFERAIIVERVNAGLARAREMGTRSGKAIGHPKIDPAREQAIREALAAGTGINKTARLIGCGVSAVQRIKRATAGEGAAP